MSEGKLFPYMGKQLPMTAEMLDALNLFLVKVTIPILCDGKNGANQIGTGTFIEVLGQLYLVTAQHIFEGEEMADVAIPNPSTGKILTLGSFEYLRHNSIDFDVAVLLLKDTEVIKIVRENWRILSLDNVKHPSDAGVFILCGYPSALARKVENQIGAKLLSVFSERIERPISAEEPIHDELDLFFYHDQNALSLNGTDVETPRFVGTSGCSIWECTNLSETDIWTPERFAKIVGVQSSTRHGEYFRAKSWKAVTAILNHGAPLANFHQ
jgi:hypothetical protein